MRDIKQLKKKAKQKRDAKKPPTITGGTTQIDLALDAAADRGEYSAALQGRKPPLIAKQYLDEGFQIVETLAGFRVHSHFNHGFRKGHGTESLRIDDLSRSNSSPHDRRPLSKADDLFRCVDLAMHDSVLDEYVFIGKHVYLFQKFRPD